MRLRHWTFGTLVILAAVAAPQWTVAAEPTAPAVVVRLKSIDGLMGDVKYIAGLVGQEEQAKQFQELLNLTAGPKGLSGTGIDTKRPIGLYGIVGPGGVDSYGALLIPVADETAFVEFVKNGLSTFGADVSKGPDGIYTVKHSALPVEAYFTVADRYAYVSAMNRDNLEAAKRVSPSRALAADDNSLASVTIHVDQLPDLVKQLALSQIELRMAAAKDQKQPGETPAQTALRTKIIDVAARRIQSLLTDAQTAELKVVIDSRSDEVSAQFNLTAKDGSRLAQEIGALGGSGMTFGAIQNMAMRMGVHVAIPEELRQSFAAVVEESYRKEADKETDAAKKALAAQVFQVIGPVVRAGRLNMFVGLHGPDPAGKFTAGVALRVPDGKAVEKLAKDLLAKAPAPQQGQIHLDVATVAGTSIHRINVGQSLDADTKQVFGENAEALLAFPTDSLVVTLGANAAAGMKSLLESKTANPAPPFALDASVGRLAGLGTKSNPEAQKAAAAVFGPNPQGKDLVRFNVEGGSALRVHFQMSGQVIKFGAELQEKGKDGK